MGLVAGWVVLGAAWYFSVECDEACNENLLSPAEDPRWWATQHAWQWPVQMALATVAFIGAIATLVLAARRSYRPASWVAATVGVGLVTWALMMEPVL
jgi:hypothetical protein